MKLDEVLESGDLTCALPYNYNITEMLESIRESARDKKERAIAFCTDDKFSSVSVVGEPFHTPVPKCPVGKTQIGDFHTHYLSPEFPKKSIRDWHLDMKNRKRISCVGAAQITKVTIVCHRFDTQHPEYENFRERFLAASTEAKKCELELIPVLKSRPATLEESSRWIEGYYKIKRLVEEGKAKGIISSCPQFSMPDVGKMLEEQR